MEFYRGAQVIRARSGASFAASAVDLTMRNTRRYGGYIVHMGMVLIFVGLAGAAFNKDVQKEMQIGLDAADRAVTTCCCRASSRKPEKNYTAERMIIEVMRDNKPMMMLYPERRFFQTNEQSGTMVAIYSTLKEDLYVVYAGQSPDKQTAGDPRVSESAGEVDLAGRRDRGAGDVCHACCRIDERCWRSLERRNLLRARSHGAIAGAFRSHCGKGMTRSSPAGCLCFCCMAGIAAFSARRGASHRWTRARPNRRQVHVHVRLQPGADAVQSRRLHDFDRDAERSWTSRWRTAIRKTSSRRDSCRNLARRFMRSRRSRV